MFTMLSSTYLPLLFAKDESYDAAMAFLSATDAQTLIVVTEAMKFLPLAHLAPEGLRRRMFYLTDLQTAKEATDPAAERMMILLKPFAPQAIVDVDEFIAGHKTFLLYYTGTRTTNSSLSALLTRGCDVALVKKNQGDLLFSCSCTRR